jgi:hypothetical protein
MSIGASHKPFRANERLEAFSDGVFAIVIALLVIELALPHLQAPRSATDVFKALLSLRGRLVSYFICFLFVGQIWVAHTNFFRLVAKSGARYPVPHAAVVPGDAGLVLGRPIRSRVVDKPGHGRTPCGYHLHPISIR